MKRVLLPLRTQPHAALLPARHTNPTGQRPVYYWLNELERVKARGKTGGEGAAGGRRRVRRFVSVSNDLLRGLLGDRISWVAASCFSRNHLFAHWSHCTPVLRRKTPCAIRSARG